MGREEGRYNRGGDEKAVMTWVKRRTYREILWIKEETEKERGGEEGRIARWLVKWKWKRVEVQRYPGGMYLK